MSPIPLLGIRPHFIDFSVSLPVQPIFGESCPTLTKSGRILFLNFIDKKRAKLQSYFFVNNLYEVSIFFLLFWCQRETFGKPFQKYENLANLQVFKAVGDKG